MRHLGVLRGNTGSNKIDIGVVSPRAEVGGRYDSY